MSFFDPTSQYQFFGCRPVRPCGSVLPDFCDPKRPQRPGTGGANRPQRPGSGHSDRCRPDPCRRPCFDPCDPCRRPCFDPCDPCRRPCFDPCDPHRPPRPGPFDSEIAYLGYPDQVVSSGGDLVFVLYDPMRDRGAAPESTIDLPRGTYLVHYAVNASASLSLPTTAGPAERVSPTLDQAALNALTTVTVGIAPKINGVPFPRGGSFATIPFNAYDTYSTTLSSTFVVELPNAVNTIGFQNTATMALPTEYQLLNITVQRLS